MEKTEVAEPPKPVYPVISPLLHDGTTYQPGDTVQLTDELASTLLAFGVIGEAIA